MSSLFDRLEDQLREAAQAQVTARRTTSPPTRLRRLAAAGGRGLPVAAAIAGAAAVVIAALVLLHSSHTSTPPHVGGHGSGGPTLPLPGSPRAQREMKALARVIAPVHRSAICQDVTLNGRAAPRRPGRALLSVLSALRRPAPRGKRHSTVGIDLASDGVLPYPTDTWRVARVTGGVTYTLAPVRVLPGAGQPPARCLAAEARALRRGAETIPSAIRAQTVRLGEAEVAYERRVISAAPYDTVCLIETRRRALGSTCPVATSGQLRHVSIPSLQSGPPLPHSVFVAVVPDGVTSATVDVSAWEGHPATSLRGRVVGNVLIVATPHWFPTTPPDPEPTSVTWRDARGRVIAQLNASTLHITAGCPPRRRLQCLVLQSAVTTAGGGEGAQTTQVQTNPG